MYTGPNIITDGLVLYLDAANTKSYTSGSTSWSNLTDNKLSFNLNNGPTFTTENNGGIRTDGTNDNFTINRLSLFNSQSKIEAGIHWALDWTVESFFEIENFNTASYSQRYWWGNYSGGNPGIYPTNPLIAFNGSADNVTFSPNTFGPSVSIVNPSKLRGMEGKKSHLVFTMENGTTARLYLNGELIGTTSTNLANEYSRINSVDVIKVNALDNDKVYVGGTFGYYKGNQVPYGLARLTNTGDYDSTLVLENSSGRGIEGGFTGGIHDILITGSNLIVAGEFSYGRFSNITNQSTYSLAFLTNSGSRNSWPFNSPSQTYASYGFEKIKNDSSGSLYTATPLSWNFTVSGSYFHKYSPTGIVDKDFMANAGAPNNLVYAITVASDDRVYVGGTFTTYKSVTNNRIICFNKDGVKDTNFDNSTGFNNSVYDIVEDANGNIYVGGVFTTYKSVTNNRIIRLNSNGIKDSNFDNSTGFDGDVRVIKIDANGKLIVAGNFTTYKGSTYNRIVRLNTDGSIDTSFNPGIGFDRTVKTIDFDSNGKIYVGGQFSTYSGSSANGIVRLNTNGTIDTEFIYGTGFGRCAQRPQTTDLAIGGIELGYMQSKWYINRLYNRALTAAEVLQNYNATKSRFNL